MTYDVMQAPETMIDVAEEQTLNDARELRGYTYDYDDGKVVTTLNGRAIKNDAASAYLLWVVKNLVTERYERAAYSSDFGIEFRAIVRKNYSKSIAESELKRTITEALSVDERTKDVSDFKFRWEGANCHVHFLLKSIYGEHEVNRMLGVYPKNAR